MIKTQRLGFSAGVFAVAQRAGGPPSSARLQDYFKTRRSSQTQEKSTKIPAEISASFSEVKSDGGNTCLQNR